MPTSDSWDGRRQHLGDFGHFAEDREVAVSAGYVLRIGLGKRLRLADHGRDLTPAAAACVIEGMTVAWVSA
jgi:hypothetical protein